MPPLLHPSSTVLPDAIAALPEEADELTALLRTWSEINSGSDNLFGLARMAAALRATFSAAFPYASVEEVSLPDTTALALRLRIRPKAPFLILCSGHFDTVYEKDHPFQRTTLLSPETLRGPGVTDMKGGIVVLLATLRAFEKTPHAQALGFEILLTPDEEVGSRASLDAITVSASRNHFGLVFEPARAGGEIVRSRKGTGVITATCHGRAAHGAQPEAGRNAIAALAEFIVAAHRVPEELPGVMLNVGVIRGGGVINIVPDLAVAELHARITRIEQKDALLARLEKIAAPINSRDGYKIVLDAAFDRPPKECGPVELAAFAAYQASAAVLGLPPLKWVDTGGGSDGNLLSAAGLPNLDGVGIIGDHLHSDRECCHLPSIVSRAQLAALFLHRLAAGEITLPR